MVSRFCPGYVTAPFDTLAADYPDASVYPARDFRVEWGPIFHRGRLDGSAKVLVLGQDPAAHEAVTRRILVGEAGQRVQGLLAKVGVTESYVMINTFLYSVFGQNGGNRHADDSAIADYRNRWLDALLLGTPVTAVITLGTLARRAYGAWASARPDRAAELHLAAVRHPTFPESSAASGAGSVAEATRKLLADWNEALPGLGDHVDPDPDGHTGAPIPYGTTWAEGDLQPIPEADLPAGGPPWWRELAAWARRTGPNAQTKRATITVTIPRGARTWPPLGSGAGPDQP